MTKRILLLLFPLLLVLNIKAQNDLHSIIEQAHSQKIMQQPQERAAAFLEDSMKVYNIETNGDSTLVFYERYQYNTNGTLKSEEYQFSEYKIRTRYEYFYLPNKPFLLQSSTEYRYNYNEKAFKLYLSDSFFYDNKDREVKHIQRNDNNFIETTISKYNSAENRKDTVRHYFNSNVLSNESFFTYDSKGILKNKIVRYYQLNYLNKSLKYNYLYNTQNQITEEFIEQLDRQKNIWLPSHLNTYIFKSGLLVAELSQEYYDASTKKWTVKDSIAYNYAKKPQNDKIESFKFDFKTNQYVKNSEVRNKFDQNANLSREEYFSQNGSSLVYSTLTKHWYSFYNNAVSTTEQNSKDYDLIYQNPIDRDLLNVKLSASFEGDYSLKLFDTQGVLINATSIQNNHNATLDIKTAGHYILVLGNQNNQALLVKRVMKL